MIDVAAEPVSFAAEFEVASLNRRRSPRAPVSLDAKIGRGGLDRALCKVTDLSLHGARLQTYSALRRGSHIWLTLPRLGPIAAEVMWADDFGRRLPVQDAVAGRGAGRAHRSLKPV